MSSTLFAVSSGSPPAAIAVLRISGPCALAAARALMGRDLPAPRQAALRRLRSASHGLIDRALVLVFPGPDSATGEDLVELHLHGGRAVVAAAEEALACLPDLRRAEPGEFTRRALANGRIDLTEAEGLGDLLLAETEAQRRAALRSAEGSLRRLAESWNQTLLGLAADVEAQLDFAEEDEVSAAAGPEALRSAAYALCREMQDLLVIPAVERLRDGVRVVIAGPPNSGKSTLLNALVGREAAIVSPISGTTRDRIEAPVVRDGHAFLLIDTAGLSDATQDPIERIGVTRANEAIGNADIVLWLDDVRPPRPGMVWVHARNDQRLRDTPVQGSAISISAATGSGIEALWRLLAAKVPSFLPRPDQLAVNQRQRALIGQSAAAVAAASEQPDLLLVAEELRRAMRALDQLTGRTDVEAMLDVLFARFCIGK